MALKLLKKRLLTINNSYVSKMVLQNQNNTSFLRQIKRSISDNSIYALVNCKADTDLTGILKTEKEEYLKGKLVLLANVERNYHKYYPDVPRDLIKRILEAFDYSLPSLITGSGLMTYTSYKILNHQHLTEENLLDAMLLGWCVDMHLGCLRILDDIVDNTEMRNEKACWYTLPGVGMNALIHAKLFVCASNQLLDERFRHHSNYSAILESFKKYYHTVYLAEFLDIECIRDHKLQMDLFTMDYWKLIIKYKSSEYVNKCIALALLLSNYTDTKLLDEASSISKLIGEFYQMQNDFVDYYTNMESRSGDDIQRGRVSWLAAAAMEQVSPKQREIFVRRYGSSDENNVQAIKDLYKELRLDELYFEAEDRYRREIQEKVMALSDRLPPALFLHLISPKHDKYFNENIRYGQE